MRVAYLAIFSIVAAAATLGEADAQPKNLPSIAKPAQTVFGSIMAIHNDDEDWTRGRTSTSVNPDDEPAIARFYDRALRIGPVLWLRLEGKRTLKIVDEGKCQGFGTCMAHRLVDWWPRLHYYVITAERGEGGTAYLIREADGLVVSVPALPILSPTEQYAVSLNPSVINGGGDLKFLDMRSDPPAVLPFKHSKACPNEPTLITVGPEVRWIDSNKVLFGKVSTMDMTFRQLEMQIVDGGVEAGCLY